MLEKNKQCVLSLKEGRAGGSQYQKPAAKTHKFSNIAQNAWQMLTP